MKKWAALSKNKAHRYVLGREWDSLLPQVMFILLNPSTADDEIDDPTSRKGIGFARRSGFGKMVFCNLFAFRATNPKALREKYARIGVTGEQEEWHDMVGPENNTYIRREIKESHTIIAAWGAHETWGRDEEVMRLLGDRQLHCLGRTRNGNPKHILYLPYTSTLSSFGETQ